MDGYLLDTNMLEYWFNQNRNEHANVVACVKSLPDEAPLFISAVTLGEIEYGYQSQSPHDEQREMEFRVFMQAKIPSTLPIDKHTAEPYGQLRTAIFNQFAPGRLRIKKKRPCQLTDHATASILGIDENDLWITAQAVQYNLVLVTNDGMFHIRTALNTLFPDVRIVNWAAK